MKFQRYLSILFLCMGIVAPTSIIQAQDFSDFQSYYHKTLKDNHIVGSSVMIIKNGEVVFADHYGKANLETGEDINDQSIFHWASITKTLTGIGILQLCDRGLLKLEDPAVTYLPELRKIHDPNNWLDDITILTLLNHSSGLRGSTWPWKSKDWHPHEPQSWNQLCAMFPYTEILFKPGSKWSYSNPGIILLGRIIEVITTEDFEYYMEKNVLRPLGMLESYYDFAPPHLLSRVCQSYWLEDGKYVPAIFNLNTGITVSNGGLMAPFSDMLTYLRFLMNHMEKDQAEIVLKRSSLESMFDETIDMPEAVPIDVDHQGMGLCFFLEDIYGMNVVGHSGFQNGFHTHLYFHPESGYAYLIGYNSAGPTNRQMDDEIKRYIFKKIFAR